MVRLENASLPKEPASQAEIKKMQAAGKATKLPGIEMGVWFNRPTLKVGGKWLICARQKNVYVIFCPLPEKEMLIDAAPEVYFDTDHHAGSGAVLAWADKISAKELRQSIARAWHLQAMKTKPSRRRSR
jgi:hypothetical protein